MSSNKYAQKVLETQRQQPKYAAGTLVSTRAGFRPSHAFFCRKDTTTLPWTTVSDVVDKFKVRGGFILEATDIVRSAANGAKTYKILPIGATNPIFVEERFIKIKKRQRHSLLKMWKYLDHFLELGTLLNARMIDFRSFTIGMRKK